MVLCSNYTKRMAGHLRQLDQPFYLLDRSVFVEKTAGPVENLPGFILLKRIYFILEHAQMALCN
jgi:hypothetical protein